MSRTGTQRRTVSDFPELMAEWDYEKNKKMDLDPDSISYGSKAEAFWKCKNGHSWKTRINKRTVARHNCPICCNQIIIAGINDLPTMNPMLFEEWNFKKNKICPEEVGTGSKKKVWWRCKKGHEWQATIASRNHGNGCPVCANRIIIPGDNDFATKNPDLLQDWDYSKNEFLPTAISPGSSKRVHWKCNKCQHEWSTPVSVRAIRGVGCPKCSSHRHTSFAEKAIFYYFSQIDVNAIENYRAAFLGSSELDIYLPDMNIGIEYDGSFYHQRVSRDIRKDNLCKRHNIKLYRIREPGCPKLNSSSICIDKHGESSRSLDKCIEQLIRLIFGENTIEINTEKDRVGIFSLIDFQDIRNSLNNKNPSLAFEWNYEKNGNLTPNNVSSKSDKKVWWKCNKCNNEWEATIASRSQGNGCPFCCNKKILEGLNDLGTINPVLALDWNYDKNTNLAPKDIASNSGKKVWWKCNKCSHEWQAVVASRARGNGCPICGKKVLSTKSTLKYLLQQGSFVEKHKDLLEYWDYEKNAEPPSNVPANSHKEIWWKCCQGHTWKSSIKSRIKGQKCPYCSDKKLLPGFNDLKTKVPSVVLDWSKDNTVKPEAVLWNSRIRVKWICCTCGHEWYSPIYNRTKEKHGCPRCSHIKQGKTRTANSIKAKGNLFDRFPDLKLDWDYDTNVLNPKDITPSSKEKVWWKCHVCGNRWKARISHRAFSRSGCPQCYLEKRYRHLNKSEKT